MTVIKSFVLVIFLMTSGLLQCTCRLRPEKWLKRKRIMRSRLLRERPIRSRVIGIHLGTTYSSVAVYKHPAAYDMKYCRPLNPGCSASSFHDTMEVVADAQGSTAMSSCVSFTDDDPGVLIGEPAKAQEGVNPERTICGVNRLLGKKFDDPEFQGYIKTLPYKIVNKENKPHIEVQFKNGEVKPYSPEEICALIIGKLKEMAETYMRNEAGFTVILMRGYIDNKVKQVVEACDIARLKNRIVRTSREVVGLLRDVDWDRTFRVLIFELSGSSFSAILLDHDEGVFVPTAKKEDAHLGGQTLGTRLVEYFVNLIKSKYKKDISNNLIALTKLRNECEKAKISLSSCDRVMIKAQFALVDDEVLMFEEILTREMFEELNMDLFNKTMDLVERALEEGELKKTDINEILLVGGSAEIPMIRRLVKNFFEKEPLNVVNPKDAVAFAATQFASLFAGGNPSLGIMVVPKFMNVGIETIGGVMTGTGRGNPSSTSLIEVTTYYDGQTTIDIKVFEGDVPVTKDCHYLGNFQISNLPPAPRGVTVIDVIVEVYDNGSIIVTAEHEATRNTESIFISNEARFNNNETRVREYDHEEHMAYRKYIEDRYREDRRMSENTIHAMSVVHPQPRSMGFAAVKVRDSFRFQHQTSSMCVDLC